MNAKDFSTWLDEMQAKGRIRHGHGHKKDAAELLGISLDRLAQFEKSGTVQKQTDIACAALLQGIEPYGKGD